MTDRTSIKWQETTLDQAVLINPPVKIVTGTNVSFVDMKQIEPGYKFVGAAEQRTYAGGGSKFISGDTLMARITPCLENGKIGQYKSDDDLPANGSTEFIVFRGKPHFTDNEYVYYLITSPDIRNFSIGQMTGTSGRQRVPTDCFSKYPVILPPLAEQRAIAAILKMLDNKIELNRRMNATLEAMARALFKSWFVDFDPVRAKMAGRKPFDMDAATAALFPNRFASSPLGDIPKGWIVSMLSEVTAELRRGISPRYTNSGGIRVLNQKCIRNQIVSFEDARLHDHIAKPITGRELEPGDILINSTGVGTLGRVAQIWHLDEPTITDSHVTVVRPNPAITPPIYLGLNLMERQTEIEGLGEGSTGQTELSRGQLGKVQILVPPIELLKKFEASLGALKEKIWLGQAEAGKLANIRDYLLPKLISGDIRTLDAKKFVEAA